MADLPVLFCVGATRAGTSWLYRSLADHPGCALRAVKELHYWDSFDAGERERQVAALVRRRDACLRARETAAAEGRGWQVANLDRQIADLDGLMGVLAADRAEDAAYRAYVAAGAEGRLVADITPGYGLLPVAMLRRMVAFSARSMFVYLLRDPLARLWSHVRMQAERQLQAGEEVALKANRILWRILHKGQETHILARGDYPATVARLREAVPEDRLRVEFAETARRPDGFAALCRWLGLAERPAETGRAVHAAPEVEMRADLRAKALRFLKEHYDWAARELGPLPESWRQNEAEARA